VTIPNLKILIVEEQKEDQFFLKQTLSTYQKLLKAYDFDIVINLKHLNPQKKYAAVLYGLSESNPVQAIKEIKKIFPEIPFIVLDSIYHEETFQYVLNEGGEYLIKDYYRESLIKKTINDVIEKSKIFQALSEKEKSIEELQNKNQIISKFSALGEIAGNIAHEINTPLATILMNTQYLLEDIKSASFDKVESEKMLATISRTGLRIAEIVRSLKDFANKGENDLLETIHIPQLLEEAIELFHYKIKSNDIRLEKTIPKLENYYTQGRFIELLRVITNLLNNAFDALSLSNDKWINIEVAENPFELILSFIDNGIGVPSHLKEKIFEPFFTTKKGEGIGLGLNISEKIIQRHKGRLYIDSNHPHTKFILHLPKYQHKEIIC